MKRDSDFLYYMAVALLWGAVGGGIGACVALVALR